MASTISCRSKSIGNGVRTEHIPADEGLLKSEDPPPEKARHGGAPLPSVFDLGREIAAMNNRYNELDQLEMAFVEFQANEPLELTLKRHALSHAKSMAFARERALIDLALTLPAVTVADAAVMVMLAWHVSSLLKDCAYDEYEENRKKTQIEHALLNALPLIAKTAGLDLGEIGFGGVDTWIDRVTQDITGRAS